MPQPKKLTEPMLFAAVSALPAHSRTHENIIAELQRLFGVKVHESRISRRLREWQVLERAEHEAAGSAANNANGANGSAEITPESTQNTPGSSRPRGGPRAG